MPPQPQRPPRSRGWWGCLLGCCAGGTIGAAALAVVAVLVLSQVGTGPFGPAGGAPEETMPATAAGEVPHPDDPVWTRLRENPITTLTVPSFPRGSCEPGDGPTDPAADPQAYEQYLSALAACLDALWQPVVEEAGKPFTPVVVRVGDPNAASGACSAPREPTAAYYCPEDSSITISPDEDFGAGADQQRYAHTHYLWVLDHEYAHHVQAMFGMFEDAWTAERALGDADRFDVSHRLELQAACIGEATLAQGTGPFALTDRQKRYQAQASSYVADDTHGTAESQLLWSLRGLRSGGSTAACDTFSAQAQDVA